MSLIINVDSVIVGIKEKITAANKKAQNNTVTLTAYHRGFKNGCEMILAKIAEVAREEAFEAMMTDQPEKFEQMLKDLKEAGI